MLHDDAQTSFIDAPQPEQWRTCGGGSALYAHRRYLDSKFEDVIAEAVAADRKTQPATDLQARVIARAVWGAACAARDMWVATDAKADPRTLANQPFDLLSEILEV